MLAALYAGIVLAGDARANSGSDAGGKAATVATMVETGTWDVDVGYWAADADPEGRFHPLVKTRRIGDRWVQVTTLPMVYAAVPLWALGGPDLAQAVPIAGALLAAWGARRLALALGAGSGWGALWLVGAGSPVVFYAADLWEHVLGIGLVVAAVAVLIEPDRATARSAAAAGAAAGLAVAMRAEAALYLAAFAAAVVVIASLRDGWWRARGRATLATGTAAVVVGASWLLERAVVGAGLQSARTSSQVEAAGAVPKQRLDQALLTSVGLLPTTRTSALVLGLVSTVGLILVGLVLRRPPRWALLATGSVAAAVGVVVRVVEGLGFVPGTFPAAPMAAAGAVGADGHDRRRAVVATALGALPLIWLLQWRGGLEAQWGGRLTLITGVLLTVVGAVMAEQRGWREPAAVVLVAATVAVSAAGVAWHIDRTRTVGAAFDELVATVGDRVVVATYDHLPREGGGATIGLPWLQTHERDLVEAVAVARHAGDGSVVLVESSDGSPYRPPTLEGLRPGESHTIDWLDGDVLVVTPYAPTSG